MFAAAWWGDHEIAKDLVEHGEDVNRSVGGTPMHLAIGVLTAALPASRSWPSGGCEW